MSFVFPPAPTIAVPVAGTADLLPVHRVYCVGRNYDAHTREMGGVVGRDPPFFFQKNPDDLVPAGRPLPFPPKTQNLHHEVELVVALKEGGSDIPVERALDHVFGYAVGIDLTRRDLQDEAKRLQRPWTTSKAFAASAPIGIVQPVALLGRHPDKGAIALSVNGSERQRGDLADMIWSVPEIIASLSTFFELRPGDVIYTGTPSGVGKLERGDRLTAHIDGIGDLAAALV
jgi:fumarylpyruvate hydrolase